MTKWTDNFCMVCSPPSESATRPINRQKLLKHLPDGPVPFAPATLRKFVCESCRSEHRLIERAEEHIANEKRRRLERERDLNEMAQQEDCPFCSASYREYSELERGCCDRCYWSAESLPELFRVLTERNGSIQFYETQGGNKMIRVTCRGHVVDVASDGLLSGDGLQTCGVYGRLLHRFVAALRSDGPEPSQTQ